MKKITISLLGALWFNFYFISETNKFGKKILPLYFCWFCSLWFDKLLLLFQNYKFSNIFHSPINPLRINSKFQINISFVSNLDYCLFQIICWWWNHWVGCHGDILMDMYSEWWKFWIMINDLLTDKRESRDAIASKNIVKLS